MNGLLKAEKTYLERQYWCKRCSRRLVPLVRFMALYRRVLLPPPIPLRKAYC